MHRSETRIAARENATATILGHPDISVPCHVTNVSKSGLGILVKKPIASGSAVKVDWDDHFLLGRVRRVAAAGTDYRIGLELLYCSKWTEPIASMVAAPLPRA
jgi:PilZ domain-containing protein